MPLVCDKQKEDLDVECQTGNNPGVDDDFAWIRQFGVRPGGSGSADSGDLPGGSNEDSNDKANCADGFPIQFAP